MQGKAFTTLLVILLLAADLYLLKGIQAAFKKRLFPYKKWFLFVYWFFAVFLVTGLLLSTYSKLGMGLRAAFLLAFFLLFIFKFCFLLFIIFDDIRRGLKYLLSKNKPVKSTPLSANSQPGAIPRSAFLMKAGLLAGAVPLAGLRLNMSHGLYDYRIKRVDLYLRDLPAAFEGLRLGQLSDIHSGSLGNTIAVKGGVDMLMQEKPDMIFFTGDLVNNASTELNNYQDIFSRVKAPLGVFSVLGNHDYGDYQQWPSVAAKQKNFNNVVKAHKNMGWDLLTDQHRRIKINGEEIGILGIGNWGEMSRFPRYGRMDLAIANTQDLPVKLLLSHDPSHWRAQVLPLYPHINAMFSGHTHGMQFGVRTGNFQWSPIEYVYKEWAGLYHEGAQQLYVNVGYGFLGYNGRIGILPEITIFTLKAAPRTSSIT